MRASGLRGSASDRTRRPSRIDLLHEIVLHRLVAGSGSLSQHGAPEHSPVDLIALVDELIVAYVTWRTECSALTRSYGLWSTGDRRHRDALFGVYAAALEREEQAATTYRRLLEQITALETELKGSPPRPDLSAFPGSAGTTSCSARSIAQRLRL